jgi:hypothetical protein
MSSEGNRTRFSGWTPSKRDLFEQWLCRQLNDHPDLYVSRAEWFAWLEQQWCDWSDMKREMGMEKLPLRSSAKQK